MPTKSIEYIASCSLSPCNYLKSKIPLNETSYLTFKNYLNLDLKFTYLHSFSYPFQDLMFPAILNYYLTQIFFDSSLAFLPKFWCYPCFMLLINNQFPFGNFIGSHSTLFGTLANLMVHKMKLMVR